MPAPSSRRESPLSREVVVEVAVRLAREEGLDGVTMRSVAAELDVTPMALYYYVKNKDELVALIAAEVTSEGIALELGEDGWELVSITAINFKTGATDHIGMVFKREKR